MNTHRNQIAEQNLALAAPAATRIALRPALTNALPVLHPAHYCYHAALPKDRRLL